MSRLNISVWLAIGVLVTCISGCELDETIGEVAGNDGGNMTGGSGAELCPGDEIEPARAPAPSDAEIALQDCTTTGCDEGEECVEVAEERCPPPGQICSCDPATGEVTCETVAIGAPCQIVQVWECQPAPPSGGVEPPPSGTEPPPAGMEPPPAGTEPPPGGGMLVSCEGPNPADSCLNDGCPDGDLCLPVNTDECAPSSCECDEEIGQWLCTRDCGPVFSCQPPPCRDADRDGVCDAEDSTCESDQSLLMCRIAAPDCPRGTVPEVTDGCYNDRCVTWEECASATPPPPPPPVDPIICGGFTQTPTRCPNGTFCYYEPLAMCGAADAPGVCMPLEPDALCPDLFAPVCGCDGQTYPNECEATKAGTSVASRGACEVLPPASQGEACGSRGLPDCGEGLICYYTLEAMCGAGDIPGTCDLEPLPGTVCPTIFLPVCGCDGQTYSNSCLAMVAGASIAHEGACQSTQIQCGGFAGLECPRGMTCEDDPTDDCDPMRGGADCIGVCVGP